MDSENVRPRFAGDSAFWRDVRAGAAPVLAAARAAGHPAVGDPRLHAKAVVIIAGFLGSYAALLLAPGLAFALLAAMLQGIAGAAIGLCVFHDAGHGSFSSRAAVNRAVERIACLLLGPSRHFWHVKHHVLHHRAPNVHGWDDDVEARGWLRLTPDEPWTPRFAGQHRRAPLLYGLNSIEWFFQKDFQCLWQGRLNQWQAAPMTRAQIREFWLTKLLWLVLFVVPPFVVLPLPWAIAAFLAYHLTISLALTFIFQTAHLTAGMAFAPPRPDDDHASHQMRTTANFATDSPLVTWFSGGLNHQIEHHLFPGIAHTHYPALAPVVRAAAARHGLPYHDLGGLLPAFGQHLAFLRDMGTAPQ
jgi:linoleoyl-CoA desaturase